VISRIDFENSIRTGFPEFWRNKTHEETALLLNESIANMVAFDQCNPHHCYDLWMHTLHTIAGIPEDRSVELRTAAFFHDSGKPAVVKWRENRRVFYGHPAKSAEIAEGILRELGYEAPEIERILFYIRHHDDFIPFVLPTDNYNYKNPRIKEINERNIAQHLSRTMQEESVFQNNPAREIWENLISLCFADVRSQAEEVYYGSFWMDSKKHKVQKMTYIQWLIEDYFAK